MTVGRRTTMSAVHVTGVGLVLGAAFGIVIGLVIGGPAGLLIGLGSGASIGLLMGAMTETLRSGRHKST